MCTKNKPVFANILTVSFVLGLLFAGCVPSRQPTAIVVSPTIVSTETLIVPTHSKTPTFTPTPIALPELTLSKGDFYFRVDGVQSVIFSRNIAGYEPSQYTLLLYLTKTGGSKLVRIQLPSLGTGITKSGDIDETWAKNWEAVFDDAAARGINVIPVFSVWADWNNGSPDYGFSAWESNSFNSANGGPATTPAELFQPDSPTQKLWYRWLKALVQRWQKRADIAAWEIFSEVNIATGTNESIGVAFIEQAASIIREADSRQRPITASLADVGEWPAFYGSDAIDFINIHPYPSSGQLDIKLIEDVRKMMVKYNKPVMIGESGLNAAPPDSQMGKLTIAERANVGLKHAVWAGTVSGAMNGRSFWWEDGYGIYFPTLSWNFLKKYDDIELPTSNFMQGVEVTDFKPLTAQYQGKVFGAALGNEKMVIGWFRDADCEPPDWPLQPVISKQNITITVPGSAQNWKVDFYNTTTGTDIVNSATTVRQGTTITITLPDFTDDIAFKMYVQ